MIPLFSTPWLAVAASFFITASVAPVVIRLAHWRGWLAFPSDDRWHRRPTALMGGLALFAGASAGWAILLPVEVLRWIWVGGGLLFICGVVDDRRGLSPVAKLVAQFAGAGILVSGGLLLAPAWPIWVSLPVSLFWVIGITNAVNLLDNMDGLAGGVSGIAAITLGALAWQNGQPELAAGALVLAAAAGGFLIYNFRPASLFMGDSGSLFLGFSLAGFALAVPASGSGRGLTALVLVPAAVLAVPILDTTLVTLKRMLVGRRITQGGRDHSSHRLVALGLSERDAVLLLYGLSALFGILAIAMQRVEVGLALSLLLYATVATAAFGAFLSTVRTYDPAVEDRGRVRASGGLAGDHALLRAAFRHRRTVVGVGVDLLLVVAAFLVAFYIRYDGAPPHEVLAVIVKGLPLVVLVKLVVFHQFGLYRGLWWHAGTPEILRTVAGTVAGTAVAVLAVAFVFGLDGFARGALVLDGVLTAIGLVGARFAFRGLRSLLPPGRPRTGKRVLLYGAGAGGVLALRELRENGAFDVEPVGFVDDDPAKVGLWLQGFQVLGTSDDMPSLVKRFNVQGIVITTPSLNGCRRERLRELARREALVLLALRVSLVPAMDSADEIVPTASAATGARIISGS